MPNKSNNSSDYSQPDFYHFSEDSILLANEAIIQIRDKCLSDNILGLDLCSGCGIVGMEILRSIKSNLEFESMEIQDDFIPHFKKNIKLFNLDKRIKYIQQDFSKASGKQYQNRYDFIVCNPPYFNPDQNRVSSNYKKNICRFFIHGNFHALIDFIDLALKKKGFALFLTRTNKDNMKKLTSLKKYLPNDSVYKSK